MTPPQLVFRGGRTIADLSYKNFYYGATWAPPPGPDSAGNPHVAARAAIEPALAAAMQDAGLNGILAQYVPGQAIRATPLTSEVIADDVRPDPDAPFDETDIRRVVAGLLSAGRLGGLDFATTAINVVLPMGMTLAVAGLDEAARPPGVKPMPGVPNDAPNASTAIAGYHGTVPLQQSGASHDILYSVVVWSDGATGIPVPGWPAWQAITATLYHELQEIRTNPDVDQAVRTGDSRFIAWNTDPLDGPDGSDCREIADLPLILNHDSQHQAFMLASVAGPDGQQIQVPIQRLWCNETGALRP